MTPAGASQPSVVSRISPISRLRHKIRTRVSEHPALYLPLARHKYPGPSPEVMGSDTELVIDGYTRSATTFAVYAFQLAQDHPVRVAHHLHAPAQLIAAARRKVPTLSLIREPEDTILSQLVREPNVDLRDALVAYTRFYACLLPYRANFVVGEFDQVTADFGSVIRRINARFGTSFAEFEHTDANVRQCLELARQRPTLSTALLGFESGVVTLAEVLMAPEIVSPRAELHEATEAWVPSAGRERMKGVLRERWRGDELEGLRKRAHGVYERFVRGSTI